MSPLPAAFAGPTGALARSRAGVASASARRPPARARGRARAVVTSAAAVTAGLAEGEVVVRFINTGGDDVLAPALPGENLLAVGDAAGVQIPRGCLSGLCGSCTSDVVCSEENGGVQVVRACQTSVHVAEGEAEMVVDVGRMKDARGRAAPDPMARFDGLDTEYVAGAAPRRRGARRVRECDRCGATGDIVCYACDGLCVMAEDASYECTLCMGTGAVRCAACQGTGRRVV
jgi:hypothetical protein